MFTLIHRKRMHFSKGKKKCCFVLQWKAHQQALTFILSLFNIYVGFLSARVQVNNVSLWHSSYLVVPRYSSQRVSILHCSTECGDGPTAFKVTLQNHFQGRSTIEFPLFVHIFGRRRYSHVRDIHEKILHLSCRDSKLVPPLQAYAYTTEVSVRIKERGETRRQLNIVSVEMKNCICNRFS